MSQVWIPKNFDEVCKRAAGRRRYHAQRRRARDERQLINMGILAKLNWPRYGIGRTLAEILSVDPATVSRDLRYLRKWRASFMEESKVSEKFADAIIQRLVAAGIHPRLGYSWTYKYVHGFSTLTVKRAMPSLSVTAPCQVEPNAKTTSGELLYNWSFRSAVSNYLGSGLLNVPPLFHAFALV